MEGRSLALLPLVAALLCAAPAGAATITVDVTNDELNEDGDCTLREAIESANENQAISGCAKGQNSRDTIRLKAQQYTVVTASDEDQNQSGDFDVGANGPVTIEGKGPGETTVFHSGDDRLFDLSNLADVTMSDLRVSGGDVTSYASVDAYGGNIRVVGGKLRLDNVDVGSGDAVLGGAIYATSDGARVNISKGLLDSNDATVKGGTLALQSGAEATIKRTTMQLSGATSPTDNAEGGIIFHAGDSLKILDSMLQGSSAETSGAGNAALGAGIYSSGDLTIRGSTIRGNTASADQDNTAEHGGGVYVNAGDDILIVNSTFFDNRAGGPGDNDGIGGAVFAGTGQVDVKHSTFDSNIGSDEGDTFSTSSGSVSLFGSIIDDATDPCAGGGYTSAGFNVSESIDAGCNFVGSDVPGGDPGLAGITDNGGPTDTIALTPTSDAKNLVPKGKCKAATGLEDQRGFTRPKGKRCDAGSFELGAKP